MLQSNLSLRSRRFPPVFYALLILAALSPASPSFAVDPVTAGVAAGLTVEIVKGINAAVAGNGNAQVHCRAQLTGPDADDVAVAEPNVDINDLWFGIEYDLDCGTPKNALGIVTILEAPNGGDPHKGWSELHWHYKNSGWRPNLVAYQDKNGLGGYYWNFAVAHPDTTPVAGNNGSATCPGANATCAAAVSAFRIAGEEKEDHLKKVGSQIVKVVPAGAPVVQGIDTEPVSVSGFSTLYFTPESFYFAPEPGGFVRVMPRFGRTIPIMHATGTVNVAPTVPPSAPPALLSPVFHGITPFSSTVTSAMLSDVAASSSGHAVYSETGTAELTLAGLALRFNDYTVPDLGNPLATLEQYFASPLAVETLAPAQAQSGYVPNVTHREVVRGSNPISASGVDPEISAAVPPAIIEGVDPDGGIVALDTPMVGLLVGVEGNLLDALNLSAATVGTSLNNYFTALPEGAEFELNATISSGSTTIMAQTVPATAPVVIQSVPTMSVLGAGLLALLLLAFSLRRIAHRTLPS